MRSMLEEMIAIPSLSGEEAEMADYICARFEAWGYRCQRDREDNVVVVREARIAAAPQRNTLHLSGHTDTVIPVAGWSIDPYTPSISQHEGATILTGLGASDMKGGLATMLGVAESLAQEAPFECLRLIFSFTVCEERSDRGKRNGVHEILKHFPGRWAVTTEASCDLHGATIGIGCQGHAIARMKVKGKACHSASPEEGINAIHAAAQIAERAKRMNLTFTERPLFRGLKARSSLATTQIDGGQAPNIVPDTCTLTLSRRLIPGETVDSFKKEVAEFTRELQAGIVVEIQYQSDAPACVVDEQGPLLQAAELAFEQIQGITRYSWNRARTDQVLFKQAGLDVLNIGPGFFGQAHVPDEYLRLSDLNVTHAILLQLCRNLDASLQREINNAGGRRMTNASA